MTVLAFPWSEREREITPVYEDRHVNFKETKAGTFHCTSSMDFYSMRLPVSLLSVKKGEPPPGTVR